MYLYVYDTVEKYLVRDGKNATFTKGMREDL